MKFISFSTKKSIVFFKVLGGTPENFYIENLDFTHVDFLVEKMNYHPKNIKTVFFYNNHKNNPIPDVIPNQKYNYCIVDIRKIDKTLSTFLGKVDMIYINTSYLHFHTSLE